MSRPAGHEPSDAAAEAVFLGDLDAVRRRSDRVFAWLMAAQWVFAIVIALTYSPFGWEGKVRSTHVHVLAAALLGGWLTVPVILLTLIRPGWRTTRQVVTVAQLLWSALLIHLTGGRIETHFHVFGSLAFIAFYRDWTLLVLGTVVVAGDHLIRGIWWPESVYGIENPEWWRFLEHAFWVAFENIVLVMGIRMSLREMRSLAQRQEDLRTSFANARLVAQSASDGIITIDVNDRISFVNPAAAGLFGYREDELLDRAVADVMPEVQGKVAGPGAERRMVELRGRRRDGTEVSLEASFGELALDGSTKCTAFLRDITERKKVDRLKSELLSTVSHELRTPLTSLRGFVELLLNRVYAPEKQRELLTIVHNETIRLGNLINDFLDIQRIESGRQTYSIAPVDLAAVARETQALFTREGSRHRVRCAFPSDLPRVLADADRLRQVFSNLVSNAIKFSPDGGEILVEARGDADQVTVSITDQGMGIPQEAIPHLFTKFFRVDNRETRSAGGSGLGLALVKEIVEAQRGRVWVETVVGHGSKFSFTLPRATAAVAAGPPAPRADRPSRTDVLVVEDDPAYAELLCEHLEEAGCRTVTTAFGERVAALARELGPRLVLLDVHLGGSLDGWDVLLELAGDPATRDVPVILTTLSEARLSGIALDGAEVLKKPVDLEDLIKAMRRLRGDLSRTRVLVVDDDPGWRHGMIEALKPLGGLEISYAKDGRGALEKAFACSPHFVLLDLGMPEVDGLEVLRRLRADKRTLGTSVIVITGKDLSQEESAAIRAPLALAIHKNAAGTGSRPLVVEEALRLLQVAPVLEPALAGAPAAGVLKT